MGMSFIVWRQLKKLSRKQDTHTQLLNTVLQKLEELRMALSQDFIDLTKKIDDATNTVAARIATLSGQVKNSMTDAEVAAIKTGLQAEADRLTTLGQDPTNPVPPA